MEPLAPETPPPATDSLLRDLIPAPRGCPPLPRGIKVIRYQPKAPPLAIDTCSVVVDVEKFIRGELIELDARLHSPVQIRAGHGVFTILDRLAQVGLELAIEAPSKRQDQLGGNQTEGREDGQR